MAPTDSFSVASGLTKESSRTSSSSSSSSWEEKGGRRERGREKPKPSSAGQQRWSLNSIFRSSRTSGDSIVRILTPTLRPVLTDGVALYEATFSVGGMTCAACSARVTEVVSGLKWVRSVSVDLMGNSATVVFDGTQCGGPEAGAEAILQEVEDTGFDCTLEGLEAAGVRRESVTRGQIGAERRVTLRVDGMSCTGCPTQVAEAIVASFPNYQLEVESPPITLTSPVIHIRYTPRPPEFTLRHIAAAISSVSPDFVVSVYHPPTLEERSRQLQQEEQLQLLVRLIFCIIIAIPTFLIGIVWMSLVSKNDPIRISLEQQMWAGRVSRMEWALFFLATPVMFCIANIFHRRAISEIRALWRKGSPTPIMRRFYRFGSMNLLISLGVSISYFASVALLCINASIKLDKAASGHMRNAHISTYFDSTVFLTMFLLIGRFLEAYSKRKTADAVSLLGKLRPSEALLVVHANQTSRGVDTPTFKAGRTLAPVEEHDPSNADYEDNRLWRIRAVSTDQLEVGDIVSVVRGSSPPADGTIISGQSQFDESSLTGEDRLVSKFEGDAVFAGTINEGQAVNVRIDCIGVDTMLDQIVKVVREGHTRRAPIERLADVLTGYFVPFVTLLAISTWVIWLGLGESGTLPDDYLDFEHGGWPVWSLGFAIAVFVIACPCGIGLAAPTALYVGSGVAAKFGILAKGGGEAFQEASWLDCMVFDKTGTLTQGGEPKVTDELMLVGAGEDRRMAYTISQQLELASAHPLARAIVTHCSSKEKIPITMWDIEETPGRGLSGVFKLFNNKTDVFEAVIGNERFMEENGVLDMAYHDQVLDSWKAAGKSVVLLAVRKQGGDGKGPYVYDNFFRLVALYAARDTLRPEAPEVIQKLQNMGIGVWMLSGDNPTTAIAVASTVGIPRENVIAGVLPAEKAAKIQWLQQTAPRRHRSGIRRLLQSTSSSSRAVVAMVGDGINDAPALSVSDVGISIGSGSDVAIGSAKFILVTSNLRSILTLTNLATVVFRRVLFNFLWACVYNIVALPVAAGALYPVGDKRIRLDPVWAALAMAFSSVSVICSSLLMRTEWWGVGFKSAKEKYR